jgi:hypothetical protein
MCRRFGPLELSVFKSEFDAMRLFVQPGTRITFLAAMIAIASASVGALAQSGSAGGSIGNDEKSLSGSRGTPRSTEPERRARRPEREEPRRASRGGGGANSFDGSWSYVAVGTTCQATASGAGIIANGRAVGAGTTGGVTPSGAYHAVTVGNDGIVTTATGHISGNRGSGTFTRSDGCNGRWSSTRQ